MDYLKTLDKKKLDQSEAKDKAVSLKALNDLGEDIRTLLSSLEKTGAKTLDKDFVAAVKGLEKVAKSLSSIKVTSDEDIKQAIIGLTHVLANLDVKPQVHVAPAKVTVNEREIDFKPLIKEINKPVKTSSLSEYKAQDINDEDPSIQYIGFVNPQGSWYIIENNLLDSSLRYKFGKSGYSTAWQKPQQHKYRLLNEAYSEI